jgi:hypothetical protein
MTAGSRLKMISPMAVVCLLAATLARGQAQAAPQNLPSQ